MNHHKCTVTSYATGRSWPRRDSKVGEGKTLNYKIKSRVGYVQINCLHKINYPDKCIAK